MFALVDHHAYERGWTRHGLGVWVHNTVAIAAYEKLGFAVEGDIVPSTSHEGWFYQRMLLDAPARLGST
jgi:RimJ/RimL family protein N-acetyltransferase